MSAEISEGNRSWVRVAVKGVRAVFNRPYPRKKTNKGAVNQWMIILTFVLNAASRLKNHFQENSLFACRLN